MTIPILAATLMRLVTLAKGLLGLPLISAVQITIQRLRNPPMVIAWVFNPLPLRP